MSITAAYSASASASSSSDSPAIFPCPEYDVPGYDDRLTFRDHPLQQDDVRVQVFDDGSLFSLMVQPAAERSADASVAQRPAQLSDPADLQFRGCGREDVFLAFLLNGQQTLFDRISGMACTRSRRVMPGCILPLNAPERIPAYPAALRQLRQQTHQTRTRRERDTDRETGMGVTPVPTVSGSSIRFSQEWITPSPDAATHRHGS